MKIKALSIWQPWASLIAVGAKKYETRSWATSYRGPLLICAAKVGQESGINPRHSTSTISLAKFTLLKLLKQSEFFDELFPLVPKYGDTPKPRIDLWVYSIYQNLPFGQAVAIVDLVECVSTIALGRLMDQGELPYFNKSNELHFGDFSPGRFAWKLENVRLVEPFPVKGRQGLFEVEILKGVLP